MDKTKPIAALFDLDGVVIDTESQYSVFWHQRGELYCPDVPCFENKVKGMTLNQILDSLGGSPELKARVRADLKDFEAQMVYPYIPGVIDFIGDLRAHGVKTAVVTSSDASKMRNVYCAHPEFKTLFDRIFIAEDFKASKPDPDCYLLGAREFGVPIGNCFVFEDSFNGLEAGNRAGMLVIGLATTNPAETICDKACCVLTDFTGFTYEKMMALVD